MTVPARLRRCAVLLLEPRESLAFDFASLISGRDGLAVDLRLLALAPHLGVPVEVTPEEVGVLGAIAATPWTRWDDAAARFPAAILGALLDKGLLLGDGADEHGHRARDERMRNAHWWTPAAVAHYFGRWNEVSTTEGVRTHGCRKLSELRDKLGPPPEHASTRTAPEQRVRLPRAPRDAFDDLLDRRATCRNFDTARSLPQSLFAQVLERTLSARGSIDVRDDTTVIKRTSPSGGGLHAMDAYVLVQRVEGLASGVYHYHTLDHALEPMRLLPADECHALALRAVAGQEYFADAHALVLHVARFRRTFWKYRNHTKAYRVLILDTGHLSQTFYLCATQAGLAAYVTGAINEVEVEQMLGLDPLVESPIAVSGLGWRAAERASVEFDPLGRVWPAQTGS